MPLEKVTQRKGRAVLNTKKAVFNKSHGSSYLSQSFILTKLKKRLRTVIEQNKVLAFVLAEAKNQNSRLKTAAVRQGKIERLLLPQLKGWMEDSLSHMQEITRVHKRAILSIHNILIHGHDVTLAPDCGDVFQEAPPPRRRSLHPPGSRLTADLTAVEEDHTGEQESFSPGQQNLPAQNEDKLLLPEILETPSNDDCQSFLHAPSSGRSYEHAALAPGQEDMRLSTSPCTEGSGFLLYERLERHRRSSETLSVSLPASPSSAAGSDVHFAFSPQTSQQPEPAVWRSPASSNSTPLADIAFVCYEDLSSPEEGKSPGVVAVAKDSPSGQASPKVPKQKLVTQTKNPRYKFFTSKNARADRNPGASKQTTVSPEQPLTDKAEPAPEALPSGRVSTSRTSERSKTAFLQQSRAATSDQKKSAEKPDEATADEPPPPPPTRRSERPRNLSVPSYKEPSVNRKMRRQ